MPDTETDTLAQELHKARNGRNCTIADWNECDGGYRESFRQIARFVLHRETLAKREAFQAARLDNHAPTLGPYGCPACAAVRAEAEQRYPMPSDAPSSPPTPSRIEKPVLSDDFVNESLTRMRHESRSAYARYIEKATLERVNDELSRRARTEQA